MPAPKPITPHEAAHRLVRDDCFTKMRVAVKAVLGFFLSSLAASVILYMAPVLAEPDNSINNIRLWHSPSGTRIVFDVSADVSHKLFTLQNPDRLVVDVKNVELAVTLPPIDSNDIIDRLRTGSPSENVLRFVFDLKQAVSVNSFLLSPNELYGHRLVVDVESWNTSQPSSEEAGDDEAARDVSAQKAVSEGGAQQSDTTLDSSGTSTAASASDARTANRSRQFVVAIDAGHGGEDPGARGYSGSKEKQITLAIAKRLRDIVEADAGMTARLIRTGDYFLNLQQRRVMAREQGADVFVSIHADAFTKRSARGFSVFAISQRGATSTMASALADKENASDLIGGVSLVDKDEILAKVLVDLSMNNTISESVNLGGRVLKELSELGHLHSKRVEQAGFMVLKSADMPSILVETGFITNPSEEKRLLSGAFQQRIAQAIYTALYQYRQQAPYFANANYVAPNINTVPGSSSTVTGSTTTSITRHTVKRGDTLSQIADRYGTTVKRIMQVNNLRKDTAILGQRLKIEVTSVDNSSGSARTTSASAKVPAYHTVVRGDSLSKISARYNITMRALRTQNNLKSDRVMLGQRIKLGGTARQPVAGPASHRVKNGDTLSDIAQRYEVSLSALKNLNRLSSNTIRVGQILKLR